MPLRGPRFWLLLRLGLCSTRCLSDAAGVVRANVLSSRCLPRKGPVGKRVPHLRCAGDSPDPLRPANLVGVSASDVSPRECGHDELQDHEGSEKPCIELSSNHSPSVACRLHGAGTVRCVMVWVVGLGSCFLDALGAARSRRRTPGAGRPSSPSSVAMSHQRKGAATSPMVAPDQRCTVTSTSRCNTCQDLQDGPLRLWDPLPKKW